MNSFYLAGKISEVGLKTQTNSGTNMCRLKLSVEKNNREQDITNEIYEVVLFRSLADKDYEVGDSVAISGKLQANNYEKDGSSYYNCNLIASSVYLMNG